MGRQGDSITVKRDQKVEQVQEQQAHHSTTDEVLAIKDDFDDDYFIWFESREEAFNGILEALRDDTISRVGLYGLEGTGKTTLAKQVGKRAVELKIFDLVVFVYAAPSSTSKTRDVKKIQDDIADQISLDLTEDEEEEASISERRNRISMRLRNIGIQVLIILDGVKGRLDLKEIGILNDVDGCNYKILLTTRTEKIAKANGCQPSFDVFLLLTEEEARHLLMKRAGIDGSQPNLNAIAKEVTKLYTHKFPNTISLMGSVLRGKSVDRWRQVLEALWDEDYCHFKFVENIVRCHELTGEVAKTILLRCALLADDREIHVDDLIRFAIRLHPSSSKNEAIAAINSLKDSCFLMQSGKSKDRVLMPRHNDVAFRVREAVSTESPAYYSGIFDYVRMTLYEKEKGIQWDEDFHRFLLRLYGVTRTSQDYPYQSSSSSASYVSKAAAAIPKPSGRQVDFDKLCKVDKSFLPLLREACTANPQLKESQRGSSEMLRQSAFELLGRLLFLLANVRVKDMVHHEHDLQILWEQVTLMGFDLGWLSPAVERAFSSPEAAKIEALQKEEKRWSEEAAELLERLVILENKVAQARAEISRTESQLDVFAITQASKAQVVPNVPHLWKCS